jgi:hypothetical protein
MKRLTIRGVRIVREPYVPPAHCPGIARLEKRSRGVSDVAL